MMPRKPDGASPKPSSQRGAEYRERQRARMVELERENAVLREALEPFANLYDGVKKAGAILLLAEAMQTAYAKMDGIGGVGAVDFCVAYRALHGEGS